MGVLTSLDLVLLAILAVSALVGLLRGIFKEAMSLVVWVAAIWVASRYAGWVSPYLGDLIPNASLRLWIARLAVLIGVLIAGGVATWLLASALRSTRLDAPDRMVGMVFGMARGVLLVALVVALLRVAGYADQPWWRESKLVPYATPAADLLSEAAEQGLGYSLSRS